jgi:hypothetical protein
VQPILRFRALVEVVCAHVAEGNAAAPAAASMAVVKSRRDIFVMSRGLVLQCSFRT